MSGFVSNDERRKHLKGCLESIIEKLDKESTLVKDSNVDIIRGTEQKENPDDPTYYDFEPDGTMRVSIHISLRDLEPKPKD